MLIVTGSLARDRRRCLDEGRRRTGALLVADDVGNVVSIDLPEIVRKWPQRFKSMYWPASFVI
jgi:hypothetical protein